MPLMSRRSMTPSVGGERAAERRNQRHRRFRMSSLVSGFREPEDIAGVFQNRVLEAGGSAHSLPARLLHVSPSADRTADRTAGTPRFVKVGDEINLWTVSDGNGFQVLRFTPHFKGRYKDVFDQTLRNQQGN